MTERTQMLHFRVTKEELERINTKREEIGVTGMSVYLRKMALDGYCVNLDLSEVSAVTSLLRRCSNNLNQVAKRANETGSIYQEDIRDVQVRLDEIWQLQKEILRKLSEIR